MTTCEPPCSVRLAQVRCQEALQLRMQDDQPITSTGSEPLSVGPRYFGELWAFLKSQQRCLESIQNPEKGNRYAPWTAFVTGIAIFLSVLALDAAQSVRHFDRIVFFVQILCFSAFFFVMLHSVAKVLGGKGTLRQAIGAGEYVIGFLLPAVALAGYCVVYILNLFPGIDCSLGYLSLDSVVPTVFNHALITLAIGLMILGIVYSVYRIYALFHKLEQLVLWKTLMAMAIAVAPIIYLHRRIEFMATLFSGELKKVASILTGSSD